MGRRGHYLGVLHRLRDVIPIEMRLEVATKHITEHLMTFNQPRSSNTITVVPPPFPSFNSLANIKKPTDVSPFK